MTYALVAVVLMGVAVLTHRARDLRRARGRLEREPVADPDVEMPPPRVRRGWTAGRRLVASLLVAVIVAAVLLVRAPYATAMPLSLGVLVGLVVWMLLDWLARARAIRTEMQVAEALDMTVSALHAGSSPPVALERAFLEAPQPLRGQVVDIVERLRLGESPVAVFALLEQRLPLEGVRLFQVALAAHWEGGGSLAPTLAAVSRSMRDRVLVARRVQGQSTEAQWSAFGVLGITYLLALMMHANDPGRMDAFLSSDIASWLGAGAILLQALGLLWFARITHLEV